MTPTTDEPMPERVGRYRLLARLGAGGMGTVYRAWDEHLDRVVALKMPRLDGPPEQQALRTQRFQREARAAALVLHPNVCPIFDVGEHEGRPFVVMACIGGPSLAQVLEVRGRLDNLAEAVALVQQVLSGIAAVHAKGIIHRDVKPANILLDLQGQAVLTDFGLARPEERGGEALTSEGMILGTPAYMAPEQASAQSDRVGPRTDLYCVGVVLYRLVTGHLPFKGPVAAVLAAIIHDDPPPPRQFRPDLDPAIESVILRALKKNPEERFTNAQEMASSLQRMGESPSPQALTTTTSAVVPVPTLPAKLQTCWVCLGWFFWGLWATWWAFFAAVLATVVWGGIGRVILLGAVWGVVGLWIGAIFWNLAHHFATASTFWTAAEQGSEKWLRILLERGMPIDLADGQGETALMKAARTGQANAVELLLRRGAATTNLNATGQTAESIAAAYGHEVVVVLLQGRHQPPGGIFVAPTPLPPAWPILTVCSLLGSVLVVGYAWVSARFPENVPSWWVMLLMVCIPVAFGIGVGWLYWQGERTIEPAAVP
jgi:Protein kinase domain/Ankyrin repeats (3 copies)